MLVVRALNSEYLGMQPESQWMGPRNLSSSQEQAMKEITKGVRYFCREPLREHVVPEWGEVVASSSVDYNLEETGNA